MATLRSLDIAVTASSATLRKDLNRADAVTKKFAQKQKQRANQMAGAFRGVATALAGLVAVSAVKTLAANADAMLKNADGAGIAFKSFQKLEFGLEQAGLSSGSLQKAMVKVNQSMKAAGEGSKSAVAELGKIGLTYEQLNKMSPEDRFRAVVDGLNSIEDKGARSALAMKLLGKEFADRELSTADLDAASAGLSTIERGAAEAAAAFNDAMNLISTNLANIVTNIIGGVLPYITMAFDALNKFSAENPTMTSILSGLAMAAGAILAVGAAFTVIGAIPLAIAGALAAVIAGVVYATNNWASVTQYVAEIISGVFGVSVQQAMTWMQQFGEWITTTASYLRDQLAVGLQIVSDYMSMALEYWNTLLEAVKSLFNLDFAGFGTNMMNAFSLVATFFVERFGTAVSDLGLYLKEVMIFGLQSAADAFRNAMSGAIAYVLTKLSDGINLAIGKLNEIPGLTIGAVGDLGAGIKTDYNTAGDRPVLGNSASGVTYGVPLGTAILPPSTAVGSTSGTGLTSAVLPPATVAAITPTVPTTPTGGGGGGSSAAGGGGGAAGAVDKTSESLTKLEKSAEDAAKAADDAAKSFSDNIKSGLSSAFAEGLKTGDWKEALLGFVDNITNQIIDTFSENLMDALFGNVFEDIFKGFGKNLESGLKTATDGASSSGWLSGLFSGLGGGGGGGGFFSSIFSGIGSFFGAADGGIVPTTPFSSSYRDSVPTMLMPGELVVPVGEVANFQNGGSGGATFNLNVTGDISRQTKKEIYGMMPELARSVNEQNKESGYK
jgi:hypothetical protein